MENRQELLPDTLKAPGFLLCKSLEISSNWFLFVISFGFYKRVYLKKVCLVLRFCFLLLKTIVSRKYRYIKKERMTDRNRKERRKEWEKEGRDGGRGGGRKDNVVKRPSETVVSLLYFVTQEDWTQKRKFNPASNARAFPLPDTLIGSGDEIK